MRLFLKVVLFTVVIPGTFAGLLPVLIVGDHSRMDRACWWNRNTIETGHTSR